MNPLLEQLRQKFANVEGLDLQGNVYRSILALLDKCSDVELGELKDADIKFVSLLAHNRLARRALWN